MTRHIVVSHDNAQMWTDFHGRRNGAGELTTGALRGLPERVDCVITSPPYKDEDGFSLHNIREVAEALNTILDGPAWVNFGDLAGQMERAPSVASAFEMEGFTWHQTIVWAKSMNGHGQYSPNGPKAKRFNTHHEYIYLMYPQTWAKRFALDRLGIGVPYTDKSNVARWKHAIDKKCPGTIWFIPYTTVQKSEEKAHLHRFPMELPDRCIRASCLKPDAWVLDPYGGSGTVAMAAKNLGFNSITYEIDRKMVDVIEKRIGDIEVIE